MRFLALAALTALVATTANADECHPDIDPTKSQYIVGYGSLMETASKTRTAPGTGPNHPVRVTGYQRAWNTRGDLIGHSTTYLGVQRDADATMVAAVYLNVNIEDITATDAREEYYCRDAVDPATLELLDGAQLLSNADVWIYYNKPEAVHPPNEIWPIVQSYVDIFITGCLQLTEKVVAGTFANATFAEQCVLTTEGWSPDWVNDRLYPRRPFIYQPNAGTIDRLLHKMIPDQFNAIRIE